MFLTNLDIIVAGEQAYILDSPLVYKSSSYILTVLPGFDFDGASIPRVLWSIVGSPMTGGYQKAGALHDCLYAAQIFSREMCDYIFYEAMLAEGVNKTRAKIMYLAVRAGGAGAYNKARDSVAYYRNFISVEIN